MEGLTGAADGHCTRGSIKRKASILGGLDDKENSSPNLKKRKLDGVPPMEPESPAAAPVIDTINPFDTNHHLQLLKQLQPGLATYEGFLDLSFLHAPASKLFTKKKASTKQLNLKLKLADSEIEVLRYVDDGAYAKVFVARKADGALCALKVCNPPESSMWEYYISKAIQERLPFEFERQRACFMKYYTAHLYSDLAFLTMDIGTHGTLQDLVNAHLKAGRRFSEVLAVYFTVHLIRIVEALGAARIIHGDIKPDNLLLQTIEDIVEEGDCHEYRSKGLGLKLIDYGRAIDLTLYPPGTTFTTDCHVDEYRPIEMRTGRPWREQLDYYAICCVAHAMLHGETMEVECAPTPDGSGMKWRPKLPFKRYHHRELWEPFFYAMLNIDSCDALPNLGYFRRQFEDFLLRDQDGLAANGGPPSSPANVLRRSATMSPKPQPRRRNSSAAAKAEATAPPPLSAVSEDPLEQPPAAAAAVSATPANGTVPLPMLLSPEPATPPPAAATLLPIGSLANSPANDVHANVTQTNGAAANGVSYVQGGTPPAILPITGGNASAPLAAAVPGADGLMPPPLPVAPLTPVRAASLAPAVLLSSATSATSSPVSTRKLRTLQQTIQAAKSLPLMAAKSARSKAN